MNWQIKELLQKIFFIVVCFIADVFALIMIISCANNTDETFVMGFILFVIMFIFFAIIGLANFISFIDIAKDFKANKEKDLTSELKCLNPYNSYEEMKIAFNDEKLHPIFESADFIITKSFFMYKPQDSLFIVSGILDIKTLVRKINGVIDYVSLSILYYDGEKYEFKLTRTFKILDMKEKVNEIGQVANIIAINSDNYKKFPTCRF